MEFCQINSLKFRIPWSSSIGCAVGLLVFKSESKSVRLIVGAQVGVQVGRSRVGLQGGVRVGSVLSRSCFSPVLGRLSPVVCRCLYRLSVWCRMLRDQVSCLSRLFRLSVARFVCPFVLPGTAAFCRALFRRCVTD